MKLALKRAWLKRLRTARKAKSVLLRQNGSTCCLGHLGKVAGFKTYVDRSYGRPRLMFCDNAEYRIFDSGSLRRVGLSEQQQGRLTALNDGTVGFGKVIAYIQKHVRAR